MSQSSMISQVLKYSDWNSSERRLVTRPCSCQVYTAACSSPTTSAPRTSWWRWTTVKNRCRRSTSPPSCRRYVDTSGSSGNTARLQDGEEGLWKLQGALPRLSLVKLRGSNSMIKWPLHAGEANHQNQTHASLWETSCFYLTKLSCSLSPSYILLYIKHLSIGGNPRFCPSVCGSVYLGLVACKPSAYSLVIW